MAGGRVSTGITAKQRTSYEMRRAGSTWEEIGLALHCVAQTARNHCAGAERAGMTPLPRRPYSRDAARSVNQFMPSPIGEEALGKLAKPEAVFDMKGFIDTCAAMGIHPRVAAALGKRMMTHLGQVREEFTKLTLAQRVEKLYGAADMMLDYIDPVSAANMNAKDLAFGIGALIDKAQLLGGKPTQIVDFNMRQKLEVLMPQFLAEAKRRGITIDGTATLVPAPQPEKENANAGEEGVVALAAEEAQVTDA